MNCTLCSRPMNQLSSANMYLCPYCGYQVNLQINVMTPNNYAVSVQIMNGEP